MITKIFILVISFVFALHAQVDSALSYYPLKSGNTWQYWYHYTLTNYRESTYVMIKVVGDTLMPNGKWYKIIAGPISGPMRTKYQRIDSNNANVYTYTNYGQSLELLSDSLRAQRGDVFSSKFRCTAIDTITFFGMNTVAKTFASPSFPPVYITYAQGLGVIKTVVTEDDPVWPIPRPYIHDLVYAKIDEHEYGTLTSVISAEQQLPTHYILEQNYPNPFNPSTIIKFSIPTNSYVSLKIFNMLGQVVATPIKGHYSKGEYHVRWNASDVGSGVYFYRLESNNYSETRKLLLQK